MTWILFLLCLAIAGRELYLAFDRKRPAPELTRLRLHLEDVREELGKFRSAQRERNDRLSSAQDDHAGSLAETDARIRSLITQINDRMLPEVNTRLTQQRETIESLTAEVAGLRDHLVRRMDHAAAASLGTTPPDTVTGALHAPTGDPSDDLSHAYELFTSRYGMRIELTAPAAHTMRYYLTGRSPRGLERDFIDLLHQLRTPSEAQDLDSAEILLNALLRTEQAAAQIGPLLLARTPTSLLCGVLPLAELRKTETTPLVATPTTAATRLSHLPHPRLHNATP
ncbi:hypothetical protein [Spirillospora sp. NPDC029432]|uniref:hypothetical protein n=1 Tax=Spirillospora sp. NPDC029432 TaxID=3154599 RepID=UPI003453708A